MAGTGLTLDPWSDEPAYKAAQGMFSEPGAFILAKLEAHDAARLVPTNSPSPKRLDRGRRMHQQ